MKHAGLILISFVAAVVAPALLCADAPHVIQRSGPARLRSSVALDAEGTLLLAFTDVLSLQVEIEGEPGMEVEAPESWVAGAWKMRRAGPPDLHEEAGRSLWSQTLLLEPLAPGQTTLSLASPRMREGEDAWQTVSWRPIPVRVTSRLAQPDLKSARDITAIEELPAPPPARHALLMVVLVSIATCGLITAAWYWQRRRQAKARGRGPATRALYELDRLEKLGLPESGKTERYATLLAGILRSYLQRRHQLPARRRTSAEFVAALAERAELSGQGVFLEAFLRRCDILKFAPGSGSSADCQALAEELRRYLRERDSVPAAKPPAV